MKLLISMTTMSICVYVCIYIHTYSTLYIHILIDILLYYYPFPINQSVFLSTEKCWTWSSSKTWSDTIPYVGLPIDHP